MSSPEKCIWSSEQVKFVGYIITPDGTEMDEGKIEAITEGQVLRSLRDGYYVLSFANFCSRFIKDFSRICRPLTKSTNGEKQG
jgi:hypothetical protein